MGLSNFQLVLLDNIIYLNSIVVEDNTSTESKNEKRTLGKIIDALLYKDGNPANGAGTGIVNEDCINEYNDQKLVMMSKDEWVKVLQAIVVTGIPSYRMAS